MFERFTDRAKKVLALAGFEARDLNHESVSGAHILLGIMREGTGVAVQTLDELGVDAARLRPSVLALLARGTHQPKLGRSPLSPAGERIIQGARAVSREMGHNYVGSEHLLVALLGEPGDPAVQALQQFGLGLAQVREAMSNLLARQEAEWRAAKAEAAQGATPMQHSVWDPPPLDVWPPAGAALCTLTAWLANRHRPLLLTHRRPDGDALGALAGMALALRAQDQTPTVLLYERLPQRYAPLFCATPWRYLDEEHVGLIAACDAVVILDTCSRQQLEPVADWLKDAPPIAVVDHHATADDIDLRACDLRVIDPTAGAACLLVHEWVQHAQIPLSSELATALYIGLATDTGWFRFSNTDARMLRAAAALVAAGVAPDRLYGALYQQEPAAKLRLIGRMLERLELHADGQLAVLTLRQADFDAAGADRTMTEDLVNEAGRIAELEATVLCSEEPDGVVRVNFRSRTRLDVAALAAHFGGGGHARAAGARLPGPFEAAVQRVVAETRAALQRGA